MRLTHLLLSLFRRKSGEPDTRFELRLQALGSPSPRRQVRTQSPFKNQPSRQAA
ncbi:hypothetical protein [Acidimangrovimonas sediminis]|uniref:hypothetical protein n=1 Tax=Acidimangrovimonas sediminis TaxID=2056283 RepID=UPI001304CB55|nr:hypothetical protein [Acidimangrovimonas sediminis]